jgi:hypothetical protein
LYFLGPFRGLLSGRSKKTLSIREVLLPLLENGKPSLQKYIPIPIEIGCISPYSRGADEFVRLRCHDYEGPFNVSSIGTWLAER